MKKIVFIIFVLITVVLDAQEFNDSFFIDPTIRQNDSTKLFLRIENNNFFKNDEYFGGLTSGLTYIGTYIQPKLVYQPYSKIKIQAGVHLLKYSGLDVFSKVLPVFSIQYNPKQGIDFIMGSINGGANHRIIEPLYSFENYLINNLENGAQLLIRKKRFYLDLWLNWENFILKTSHSQESILGGLHTRYLLFEKENKSELSLDFQSIIAHKGGQFHDADDILQTIINTATGLKYTKIQNVGRIKSYGISTHYVTYNDPSPLPQLPYLMGYAVSTELFMNTKYFRLKGGYWSGEYFVSSRGNPLFMSVSDKDPDFVLPRTELITFKIAYKRQLFKDIAFEARFEPYLDLMQRQVEYSYSFYMIFNRDFFLRKVK